MRRDNTNTERISEIDFEELNKGKESSTTYYVGYGNDQLIPFLQNLHTRERSQDLETDKFALKFMLYIVEHYEKFQAELNTDDKQKLLFSICRTVPFLSNKNVSGGRVDGIVDKYAIRHKYGFEDNNIFRDLRYLQKVIAYNREHNSPWYYGAIKPEEVEEMWLDMLGPLKCIIMLELDETITEDDKTTQRAEYLDVQKYPNIFTVAAFYREGQRLQDALDSLNIAVETLTEQAINNPEKCLFVVLRAIIIVGEFSSQKNLTFQTRLNNPELIQSLTTVKKITNDIVKPNKYDKFTAEIISNINLDDLKQELVLLLKKLKVLSERYISDTTYEEKVTYYTNPSEQKSPYLSQELITSLNNLIDGEFPGLTEDQKNQIEQLLSSDRKEKFIADILHICKVPKENKREIFEKHGELIENVKHYKSPTEDALPESELEKLVSLLKDETTKPIKSSAKEILSTLTEFLSSEVSDLPRPMEDDGPFVLKLKELKTGDTTIGGVVIMELEDSQLIKVPYSHDIEDNIKAAIQFIKEYMDDRIEFPKRFCGEYKGFVTEATINLDIFGAYIASHTPEILQYIINYGKYCKLRQFIKEDNSNQLALEFLLQTSYNLIKEAKEEADLVFPEIEYRALRHSIRHFDDDVEVMEVPIPKEGLYTHYAIRLIGEEGSFLETTDLSG